MLHTFRGLGMHAYIECSRVLKTEVGKGTGNYYAC